MMMQCKSSCHKVEFSNTQLEFRNTFNEVRILFNEHHLEVTLLDFPVR